MIRPTLRLIVATGAAAPLTVVLILADPALWVGAIGYLTGLAFAVAGDVSMSLSPSALAVRPQAPSHLFMADEGMLTVDLAAGQPAAGTPANIPSRPDNTHATSDQRRTVWLAASSASCQAAPPVHL